MTNPTELCERLREAAEYQRGLWAKSRYGEHVGKLEDEAADLIEDQAKQIAEQGERITALEAKCALLAASLAQEEARSAELERLLTEVAVLKRYDPNGNRGWSRSTLTVNMPSELLERIDASIAASKDRP